MKLSVRKIILFSLLGIMLFFITAIVMAIVLIDPNDYKQKIQSELSTMTGYNITIPGDIKLELLPRLSLAVGQIKLASKKTDQPLNVDTRKLNLNIKLLSIFSGEPKIGTVTIAKTTIRTTKKTPAHVLSDIALTSSGFKPDQQTDINVKFKYTTPNKKLLPIEVSSKLLYKSANKSIHLTNLAFNMEMLNLSGETHLVPTKFKSGSQYKINGNISSKTFSPREFAKLFAVTLPVMQNKNAMGKLSLSSHYVYANDSLKLNKLKTTFDKTDLTGNVSIHLKPDYPVNFNLSANVLNVDDYHPTAITTTASQDSGNPLVILTANLNGKIKLNKLVFNNIKTRDIVLKFASKKNKISIFPSAKLYGGTYNGSLNLSASKNTGKKSLLVSGEQQLKKVNIGNLLTDYMGDKLVTGISDLKIKFNSHGNTADILVKNMLASGNVKLTNSQLMSIKLAKTVLKLTLIS